MIVPPSYRREGVTRAEQWFGQFWTLLVRLALIAFLVYFIWRVRSILTDILVAVILALALVGPVDRLCRVRLRGVGRRTQRLIATLLVFVALGFVVYQSVALMLTPFERQALHLSENLPLYQHKVMGYVASWRAWYASLSPDWQGFLQRMFQGGSGGGAMAAPGDWLRGVVLATLAGLAKIVDVLIVPVLAFYFVLDGHALRNELLALLPRRRVRETLHFLRESSAIMRTYIIAQLWLCLIAGIVVYAGLSLIHMPYALILGLLAGVTRAIPIIGPIIGGIPIILLALVLPGGGLLLALKVLVFFSLLHLIESKLIMPKFIGHRINLHAAVVIIVLLIGGEFFGLLGMFLAAPLAAIARVLIGHYVIRPRRLAVRTAASPPLLIKTQ
ncbi:MAG: AI-2E family transporter [Armatimonadetes bacterium]|nr:AI-2E family transporter [Armatimonadota bacterium]